MAAGVLLINDMNSVYKQILKATTIFGSVQGVNILINLARTKLVAVLLGPSGVGLNSIFNEARELIHTTTNLGLDVSGVRGISQAYEKVESQRSGLVKCESGELWDALCEQVTLLRSWVLLLALFGTLVCAILATPLSLFSFGDYDHVWDFVKLAPAVGFSTIGCGEMAVLKGLRKIKALAQVSLINVIAALVVTVPIFYFYRLDGILLAILAYTFVSMIITIIYGIKNHGISITYKPKRLKAGNIMLGIGAVVVISEGVGHLVTLAVQSYLNNVASTEMVGLYSAGYTLTMTYGSMVFAAMATDYFPRLSGMKDNVQGRNLIVKSQIKVMVLLIIPLLVLFVVLMPYLVPLLLEAKFNAIIPMAQVAAVGLLFRAVVLAVNYLPLAMGDSKIYFLLNLIGALDVLVVIPGYIYGGLFGMGIALTAQNFLDMLISIAVARWYYKIK